MISAKVGDNSMIHEQRAVPLTLSQEHSMQEELNMITLRGLSLISLGGTDKDIQAERPRQLIEAFKPAPKAKQGNVHVYTCAWIWSCVSAS